MKSLKTSQSQASVKNMLAGSMAGLLLLIVITVYGFKKQIDSKVSSDRVVHTQKVISELQGLETLIFESVTAQPRYEETFNLNHTNLDKSLTTIQKLTSDNFLQQEHISQIRTLVTELRVVYAKIFEFTKDKQSEKSIELVKSGKGQASVDQIENIIHEMIKHEESLLKERLDQTEKTRKTTYAFIALSSILAILFILIVLYLMYREFARRLRAQEAVLRATPLGLVTIDNSGKMTLLNPVAEQINAQDPKGPIMMMLTSDNRPGDTLRSKQLGLKSFIVKAPAPVETKIASELSILLVDDNDENRLVIRSFLKSNPWKIIEAKNGMEAVEQFKKQVFDIVFMDMQMPVMDGYTATTEIRTFEKSSNLPPSPILALTAYALTEEVDKSYSVGCNGHLSKPISKTNLLNAITEFTSELVVTIDRDLEDLIPGYLASREKELVQLQEALKEENYPLIQSLGHKLRGSAGSYGFALLTEVGRELEENAKVKGKASIERALSQYLHYLKRLIVKY